MFGVLLTIDSSTKALKALDERGEDSKEKDFTKTIQ